MYIKLLFCLYNEQNKIQIQMKYYIITVLFTNYQTQCFQICGTISLIIGPCLVYQIVERRKTRSDDDIPYQ